MLKVNFWSTNFGPGPTQILDGYLFLEDGKIETRPDPSDPKNKILFESVMCDLLPKEKKLIKENPAKWMRSLPTKYSGSYLRAELVED